MKKVAIIMGSDSDFPIVKNAAMKLKEFNIPYEIHVMSAHRTGRIFFRCSEEWIWSYNCGCRQSGSFGGSDCGSYCFARNWIAYKIFYIRRT